MSFSRRPATNRGRVTNLPDEYDEADRSTLLAYKTEITDDNAGTEAELPDAGRAPLRSASSTIIDLKQPLIQAERAAADHARPWFGIMASVKAFF
ncbi:hypothetical protein CPAR01_07612 [Colletotrichum paranaense]|uniref:Uncharacterized protein n=1 Tax=Colletotrichum paranaense TaxID=1914294 RepID=A0ABQ9SHW2_9PEZI|nr:uncharacterized protein CPAR01_07612 [Colletotrichum paranaense]KAK1537499.1 hypothetical protein CPAR01_07612 [Colletotrichum paranaense]